MQKTEFYLQTRSGASFLVELYEDSGNVVLIIGDKRYDITANSAFDLADALLLISSYSEK